MLEIEQDVVEVNSSPEPDIYSTPVYQANVAEVPSRSDQDTRKIPIIFTPTALSCSLPSPEGKAKQIQNHHSSIAQNHGEKARDSQSRDSRHIISGKLQRLSNRILSPPTETSISIPVRPTGFQTSSGSTRPPSTVDLPSGTSALDSDSVIRNLPPQIL